MGGTADGSGTRHCPRAPKSGGIGGMTFRVGDGTVGPHVVMSRVSVWGQDNWKKKNGSGLGHGWRLVSNTHHY